MRGYIPASNYIGGFKEGVAFALRKCRRCLATGDDMRAKVYYLRNTHTYIHTYIPYMVKHLRRKTFVVFAVLHLTVNVL